MQLIDLIEKTWKNLGVRIAPFLFKTACFSYYI